jgi:hypothetical protein
MPSRVRLGIKVLGCSGTGKWRVFRQIAEVLGKSEAAHMRKLLHFESIADHLAPWGVFIQRVWRNLTFALLVLGIWLVAGVALYHFKLGVEDWSDAFESAAMIASGMGPLSAKPEGGLGGVLAGVYALGSLFVGFVVPSLVLAPVFHRVLHRFHIEDASDEN